ncbi:hypothetical protein [Nocardiopsis sp. CNT312]|uniref:hypothetical protein n=1 Tax=Nocardiopsis sp. CNT312 TaxID=1137268 RepID=UPI0012DF395C|nr:hypothetical protein [Nocardiopsis sp. CNT312]
MSGGTEPAMGTGTRRGHPAVGRWAALAAATGVAAFLVVAWPVANWILPGAEPVPEGSAMPVGTYGGYEASLTFDQAGWALHPGASTADRTYYFTRGPVELTLNSVVPTEQEPPDETELWDGMGRIMRAEDPSARLAAPDPTTSDDGTPGLTGTLHSDDGPGIASLFPSPGGDFAVEVVLGGEDTTPADLAAVGGVVRSVTFTEEGDR